MSTGLEPLRMHKTNATGISALTKTPSAVYGVLGYPSSQQHSIKGQMHLSEQQITDQTGASQTRPEAYGAMEAQNGRRPAHTRYGAPGRRQREHIPRFIPPRMLRLQRQQISGCPGPKDGAPLSFLGAPDQVVASHVHSLQSAAHHPSAWSLHQYLQSIPAVTMDPVAAQSGQLGVPHQGRSRPCYCQQYAVPATFTTQRDPNGYSVPEPTWSAPLQPVPQVSAPHATIRVPATINPRNSSKRRSNSNCAPVKIGQQGTPQRSDDILTHRSQSPEYGLLTYRPPRLHTRHATMFDPFGDRSEEEWLATAILAAHEHFLHPESSALSAMSSGSEAASIFSNVAASASTRNVESSPSAMPRDIGRGQQTYGLALFPTSIWGTDGLDRADMMRAGLQHRHY
ncbi:hypothetical protein OE88DRAFT_1805016 [Heliocybe sulcata]|uniref:Uncharacterized protein n=1 Tax=Heliocybe sulcata TaxID=5364 RepID=A0A5C3NG09_9AGAM|nr:hypothetical protein OE88DRAFT_1805016 [Heliocybe sulcata]